MMEPRREGTGLSGAEFSRLDAMNVAARAALVNRTHRIVRQRAEQISSRRSQMRSLMVPVAVSASLLVILITAVWSLLDAYEVTPGTGIIDSSNQYFVLMVWFLPLTMAALVLIWRIRARRRAGEWAR